MATPVSPSSSPRLPSPPPIAEDQSGPTSPGLSLYPPNFPSGAAEASRRIRPGTKAEDMAEGPPLTELMDIDSAFQLTEHLKALHHSFTHPSESTTTPITAELARQLAHPPHNTAKEIWLYELGRFLIQKTNAIIVALFSDTPACSPTTCHEMRASEWQYLCAVHDPPKSCSAIDYCCHTLDWAASTLCNSKLFPSRLGLGSGGGAGMGGSDKVLAQQMKEITNIFRRVYRIYAHAWFQHREVFWRVEGKTGLYVFFKTVCDEYGLIQTENYTIPPEAEGLEPKEVTRDTPVAAQPPAGMSLLKRPEAGNEEKQTPEPAGNEILATGDTTKRHRHTQSNRSNSVSTTITEEAEEDEEIPLKPSLERAPTVMKKEGGLSRSDTLKPEPEPEQEQEQEKEKEKEEVEAAQESVVVEESEAKDEGKKAEEPKSEAEEEGEEEDAEVTVIEAEVPEDIEGPGESGTAKAEEEGKPEMVIEP